MTRVWAGVGCTLCLDVKSRSASRCRWRLRSVTTGLGERLEVVNNSAPFTAETLPDRVASGKAGLSAKEVRRFSQADIPSSNHGIVVTVADGSQFQRDRHAHPLIFERRGPPAGVLAASCARCPLGPRQPTLPEGPMTTSMTPDEEYDFYAQPENQEPQGPPRRRASRLSSMVPVRFPPEVLDEIRRRAEAEDRSVSSWIRRAVEHELRDSA